MDKIRIIFFLIFLISNIVHAKDDCGCISRKYDIQIHKTTRIYFGYGFDYKLFVSLMNVESCGNIDARNPSGAYGLMQIMPGTKAALERRFKVQGTLSDARYSIELGIQYLKYLFDFFKQDTKRMIGAYNVGEGTIQKKGITEAAQVYIDKVFRKRKCLDRSVIL